MRKNIKYNIDFNAGSRPDPRSLDLGQAEITVAAGPPRAAAHRGGGGASGSRRPVGARNDLNPRDVVDFEITPEHQELIEAVSSVLAQECPTALVRDIVENASTPEQPWKSARELGWTSIDLPEALGGLELGFTALGLVIEQHGRRIAPGPFLATVTQFLPLLCEAGTPEQLERFAAPAGAGELSGALAIDHGRAADHAPGEDLRARPEGDRWILEGERRYVLDGDVADEVAVAARVDGGDGVGLFVVPQGAAKAQRVVAVDAKAIGYSVLPAGAPARWEGRSSAPPLPPPSSAWGRARASWR
jgi:hypothetical protein